MFNLKIVKVVLGLKPVGVMPYRFISDKKMIGMSVFVSMTTDHYHKNITGFVK